MKRVLLTCIGVIGIMALGATLTACSDDDGSEPVPLNQVQSAYEEAWCQKAMDCQIDTFIAMFNNDVDTCVDVLHATDDFDMGIDALVASVNAGNTEYDGAAARQCLDAVDAASCEAMYTEETPEGCQDTFVGVQAAGTQCTLDEECAGGWCDLRAVCPGICAEAVPLDGSCAGYERCESGLVCDDNVCVVDPGPAGLNESCDWHDCAYELWCDWDGTGNCLSRVGEGQDCEDEDQCLHGLYCNTMGKCTEPVVVTSAGGACGGYEEGPFCSIAHDLSCVLDMMNESFTTCEPLRQLNEDCLDYDAVNETAFFYQCDLFADLYCDMDYQNMTGVCLARKATNASCEGDEECQSQRCDSGTCVAVSTDPCD